MKENLFCGQLVRLTAENPEVSGKTFSRWDRNSVYMRLLDTEPAVMWSAKKITAWFEEDLAKEQPEGYFFHIRTLEDDRLIGFTGLFGIQWQHGDAWVSIGIGEPEYWGNGYGTEAMRLILRYAFEELNLFRASLGVFAYNPRAISSYEKAGFVFEGQGRQSIHRDGARSYDIYMGILRQEWERGQA